MEMTHVSSASDNAFIAPTLYKRSGAGKLQQWSIKAINEVFPVIITEHGQVGGKLQVAREFVKEGKNAGRANATTAWEQAVLQTKAKWTLQKTKKGYVDSPEAAMAGQVDALVEGGIFPMLAQKFEKRKDKITYPAYCQPKFDGHRCIGIVKDGVGTLWSRTRKPIKSMPHIEKAIVALSRGHDAIFDGELYNHEYHDNFQQITKLITPKAPVEGHEKVMFYIYDRPSADTTFEFRTKVIDGLFGFLQDEEAKKALVKVATLQIDSEAEAILAFTKFLDEKYEGLMLRLHDNEYLSHPTSRSPGLIKMKHFDDAEFEIVDIREGRGKFEGLAIFVCAAGNGKTFDAVMNGSLEELRDFYQHREALIGRIVTVKFMGFTNDGVPRHGRALRFREDL